MSLHAEPTVSVVISTNGRCQSLARTLEALSFQIHRNLEICVVCGPVPDGTREFIAEIAADSQVKVAICDVQNLSLSRNLGIAMAAGEFVAFIDDDALPEPAWLKQLLTSFDAPDVAGVSGIVFQPDGHRLQFRFSSCNRFGNARHGLKEPADAAAFPMSANFPHVMGTNAIFRRRALVAVGGFDEEYEYYLDEADMCCRLIDAGWLIRQRGDAPVHHKFLSGTVRDGEGITAHHFPILKNQLYFSLINGRSHAPLSRILDVAREFSAGHRRDIASHVSRGALHRQALAIFDADYERATELALSRGLSGIRRLPAAGFFDTPPNFLRARSTLVGAAEIRRRHVAIILTDGAGASLGAARDRATALAVQGDFVRLIAPTTVGAVTHAGVELQDGVWHHYIATSGTADPAATAGAALIRIATYDPIDIVEDANGRELRMPEIAYA